jgi:hypothetical protein
MQQTGPADGGVRGGPMTGSDVRYVDSGGVVLAVAACIPSNLGVRFTLVVP